MKLVRYKDTMVAPGSQLWELLHSVKPKMKPEEFKALKKATEKQYEETTKNYEKLYSEETRKWFAERQAEYFAKNKPAVSTTAA